MTTDFITINAHSSIRMDAGRILWFDPFQITGSTHDADIIFITHDHFDHFSPEDIEKIVKADTVLVAPETCRASITGKVSIPEQNMLFLAPGHNAEIGGILTEAVAAYNPAKQFHPQTNQWLGYIVAIDDNRYYVMGDTEETPEALAAEADVVLLPVGGTYTFDAAQAAAFINKKQPKIAIPTHYGSIAGEKTDGADFAKLVKAPTQVQLKLSF